MLLFSPRRGKQFVTRKITSAAAAIKKGLQNELVLGDIEAKRDWGYAKDYVKAMWLMLQQDKPSDYVIATGIEHSVKDILDIAFSYVNLDWHDYVKIDQSLMRRVELNRLVGDSSKARKELGWEPSLSFEEMIKLMTETDLTALK